MYAACSSACAEEFFERGESTQPEAPKSGTYEEWISGKIAAPYLRGKAHWALEQWLARAVRTRQGRDVRVVSRDDGDRSVRALVDSTEEVPPAVYNACRSTGENLLPREMVNPFEWEFVVPPSWEWSFRRRET